MSIYVAARAEAHLGSTHFAFGRTQPTGALRQFASAWYAPGARVACTAREIPQVGETYAVVGATRGATWGLECGVNEHGVAVAAEAIATGEAAETQASLCGEDITRLALERGRGAREALEVSAALLERFGCSGISSDLGDLPIERELGDCRFIFADPGEAWCLECAGRRWVARRTSRRVDGGAEAQPEIRDDWDIAAKNLEAYAREHRGWHGSGRLDFAGAFATSPPVAPPPEEGAGVGLSELAERLRAQGAAPSSLLASLPHDRARPWPIWISAGPASAGVLLPVYVDAPLPVEACAPNGAFGALAALVAPPGEEGRAGADEDAFVGARLREAWKGFEAELESERRQIERGIAELLVAGRDAEAHRQLGAWTAGLWTRASIRAGELAAALPPSA